MLIPWADAVFLVSMPQICCRRNCSRHVLRLSSEVFCVLLLVPLSSPSCSELHRGTHNVTECRARQLDRIWLFIFELVVVAKVTSSKKTSKKVQILLGLKSQWRFPCPGAIHVRINVFPLFRHRGALGAATLSILCGAITYGYRNVTNQRFVPGPYCSIQHVLHTYMFTLVTGERHIPTRLATVYYCH